MRHSMARKFIIANWKMHYGPMKAGAYVRAFRRERLPKELDIGIAVPSVSLGAARASLGRAGVPYLGAQNASWMEEGAMTGEVSPSMLTEFGVQFCLVGHSERRTHLLETDDMVNAKAKALQAQRILPIVCVGETAVQRKKGDQLKVVKQQVLKAMDGLSFEDELAPVVAYEPVWAIGTGKACSAQDARMMHEAIHETLIKKFGEKAESVRIIYGGSVDQRNVAEYLSTTRIDGVLVGSASLDPRTFGLICRSAHIG